ncbi:MAG: hypothetical protein FJZ96_01865 [Chloroflexi bacterium]|nr:hypothetical protein [Chloroflexota bacterium]
MKDKAYKQAEQKIAAALTSRATELDLINIVIEKHYKVEGNVQTTETHLTELPESIGQLTQLTSLYLYDNQLTALPDSPLAQLHECRENVEND